jgi:cleavage and polyadenylation specificity factor subunit 2
VVQAPAIKDAEERPDPEAEEMLLIEKPSKVVETDITVQVKCGLQYIDFEGRSDGRSIKNILAHVAPLKLVRLYQ